MFVEIKDNFITLSRTDSDKAAHGGSWGSAESALLNRLKVALNNLGYDFIKKRMYKDGHLVDDSQHYLRARNKRGSNGILYIFDGSYAIRDSAEDFNNFEPVSLCVVYE